VNVPRAATIADQAHVLRALMSRLDAERACPDPAAAERRACAIAVAGKGGVGKSNIALNLGIALAQQGSRTCLLDANLGLGNIDLLCGLNGYWNLSHVITGARTLREIVLVGPEELSVIPGASNLSAAAEWPATTRSDVMRQLEAIEQAHEFFIIDTAAGIHRSVRPFVEASDVLFVVTTPEPTAIADAYGTIKSFCGRQFPQLALLVNQCEGARQGALVADRICQTARMFLHSDVDSAGFIPRDPHVAAAVLRRRPFLLESPHSPASQAIRHLASQLNRHPQAQRRRPASPAPPEGRATKSAA
jgi:flagellar biosynthesis protein FlhG